MFSLLNEMGNRRCSPILGSKPEFPLLTRVQPARYTSPALKAIASRAFSNKDQAFVWLEKACEGHSNSLDSLKVHPMFDPLCSDPRSPDLLQRVKSRENRTTLDCGGSTPPWSLCPILFKAASSRRSPGRFALFAHWCCPNLARGAGFRPAQEPPRRRRYVQIRTAPALEPFFFRAMASEPVCQESPRSPDG